MCIRDSVVGEECGGQCDAEHLQAVVAGRKRACERGIANDGWRVLKLLHGLRLARQGGCEDREAVFHALDVYKRQVREIFMCVPSRFAGRCPLGKFCLFSPSKVV